MDEAKLALMVLGSLLFFFSIALVIANVNTHRLAATLLQHCMAWHQDQREFLRTRFEIEHQEYMLRELREKQARENARSRPLDNPPPDHNPPLIPIEADTQT